MIEKTPDPTKEIRADLWPKMTMSQLNTQRDHIVSKMSLLQTMMGEGAAPSLQGLYVALEHALTSINELIDNRFNK